MKTVFSKHNSSFYPITLTDDGFCEKLPNEVFYLDKDPHDNLELRLLDKFIIPTKIYGDLDGSKKRIVSTYITRNKSMGVLLHGDKGCGKSLLSKLISLDLLKLDIPTIIVSQVFADDKFNFFLQSLPQKCCVIIDEFEKIYSDHKSQIKLLSLLDGVFLQKHLFVLTCNDIRDINRGFVNRPGRIYYSISFDGIDKPFIKEYCEDNLKKDYKHFADTIIKLRDNFVTFSFDMLQALIEDINVTGESVEKCLSYLNINKENDAYLYRVQITHREGQPYLCDVDYLTINPLKEENRVIYYSDGDIEKSLFLHPTKLTLKESGDFTYLIDDFIVKLNRAEY